MIRIWVKFLVKEVERKQWSWKRSTKKKKKKNPRHYGEERPSLEDKGEEGRHWQRRESRVSYVDTSMKAKP